MRLQFGPADLPASGITSAALESSHGSNRNPARLDSAGPDRITLSSTSSLINRVETSRSAKIQQIAAAVQSGTYQVSSQDLSRRIVASALGQ